MEEEVTRWTTVPQPPPLAPIFAKPHWEAVVWPEYIVNVCGAPVSLAAAAHPRHSSARLKEIAIIRVFDQTTIYSDRNSYCVPLVSDEDIAANKCSYPIILNIGPQDCGSYEIRATIELTRGSNVSVYSITDIFFFVQDSGTEISVATTREGAHRPLAAADIMLLYPSFTSQAYNYFSGYNFYHPSLAVLPERRRIFVNRPQLSQVPSYHTPKVVFPFEKSLQKKKLSFNVMDSEYFQIYGYNAIASYQQLVVIGHDEYISATQRAALRQYLHSGGRISIFGGNFCLWKVDYEISRYLSVHKIEGARGTMGDDRWRFVDREHPVAGDFALSFDDGGFPVQRRIKEDQLQEIGWTSEQYNQSSGMEVIEPDHPIFEGTNLSEGEIFGHADMLMQVEIDGALERPKEVFANRKILARGWVATGGATRIRKVGTIAEATFPGGGRVLHLGSIGWFEAIEGDPVCRKIAENVVRYQGIGGP